MSPSSIVASSRLELAGLRSVVSGPADAATTVVLLHGFGAPGDDLVSLAEVLAPAGGTTRFVFPAAPLDLGGNSRAWWMIDFAHIERQSRSGADRTREVPEGLHAARAQLATFLAELTAHFAIAPGRLVIGGFSQGSMLSLDATLHAAHPPGGLIVMSGTLIASQEWTPRMTAMRGVPVVMSHGRADPLLPFATAETLRDQLIAGGADLEWLPFNGGHTIPPPVLAGVAHFVRARAEQASTASR